MTTLTFLSNLLAVLESGLQPARPLLPALAPTPAVTADAAAALARAAADAAAPARVQTLRTSYETAFGFPKPLREGFKKTIWEPWRGLTQGDMEAVLTVATVLGLPASHVLALWLQEGKHPHDATLHGAPYRIPNDSFGADVSTAKIRSWLRSLILFDAFGSDAFASVTPVPKKDSHLDGAEADHDGRFVAGLKRLRAAGVPASHQFTDAAAIAYFTSPGGALRDVVLTDIAGNAIAAVLPAGVAVAGSFRLRQASIASWLYLQLGLFTVFRSDMEQRFIAEFGPPMDLSRMPWVTYLGWNGGVESQYDARFSGRPPGETPEDRIGQLFDAPPRNPLSAAELSLYYTGLVSRSALGNAIQFKYLIDAVDPWFAPSP